MFLLAALWNLTGAGFGYFNTAFTSQHFFDTELSDPLFHAIYQGSWGTTFVYFFGYLIVAHNPVKHVGVLQEPHLSDIGNKSDHVQISFSNRFYQLFTISVVDFLA
jgi:hypothetical protein